MKRYLCHRALLLVPTALLTLTVVFGLMHMIPGDPVEVMLGETATAVDKQQLRRNLGLDQPIGQRYLTFLSDLAHADLGRSLYEQAPVGTIIAERLWATAELALAALILSVCLALPLALGAASSRGRKADRFALLFSLLGVSMPNFWLGPLLIILFSIQLGWFPVSGRGSLSHLFLPAFTLALGMAAILTRILRTSLLQVMHQDYIRSARAKGLRESVVWFKHIMRNALFSVITIMSLQFGSLLAGSIITETIFSWPGIGRLTVQAIQTRDYPLVQGCVLVIALAYIGVNFIADLLYRWVDPRVSYGK